MYETPCLNVLEKEKPENITKEEYKLILFGAIEQLKTNQDALLMLIETEKISGDNQVILNAYTQIHLGYEIQYQKIVNDLEILGVSSLEDFY